MARAAGLRQHDQVPHKTQMGAVVDHFKLLVSHRVHQLGMRQQQAEQALGQRRHGAAAFETADVVLAPAFPIALALPVALAFPVAPGLPFLATLAALLTAWRTGGLAMGAVKMPVIGVIGLFRRNVVKVMAGEVIAPIHEARIRSRGSGRGVACRLRLGSRRRAEWFGRLLRQHLGHFFRRELDQLGHLALDLTRSAHSGIAASSGLASCRQLARPSASSMLWREASSSSRNRDKATASPRQARNASAPSSRT